MMKFAVPVKMSLPKLGSKRLSCLLEWNDKTLEGESTKSAGFHLFKHSIKSAHWQSHNIKINFPNTEYI